MGGMLPVLKYLGHVQIWKRFSGSKGAPNKITFESFAKSMIWWQKAPVNYKLECQFTSVDNH